MSYKQPFENSDEFHDVELDEVAPNEQIFYIDKSSLRDVFSTVAVMFLFITVHIFTAWRAPPLITTEHQIYLLNNTKSSKTVDIDVKMTSLLESHRFIHVDGSLVRKSDIDSSMKRNIEVTSSYLFSKNGKVDDNDGSGNGKYELTFASGSAESSTFPVIEKSIHNFDSVLIKMSIQSDLSGLSGFNYYWTFGNPSGPKYARSSRILMSLMVGYMLILFFYKLQISTEKFSQIFVIIIGISAIISSNPVGLIYPVSQITTILDAVLIGLFVAFFRLFVISQFEMVRKSTSSPSIMFLILMSIFIAFHTTVGVAAMVDRITFTNDARTAIEPVNIPTEKYVQYLDYAYILINIIWIILAYCKSESSRRLNFFTCVFVLLAATILFTNTFCVYTNKFMDTILPSLTFISMHITTAAFSIMMLNNGERSSYSTIKNDNNNANILDVEEMTDDNLNDPNAEEEEVDEEEEEEEEEE